MDFILDAGSSRTITELLMLCHPYVRSVTGFDKEFAILNGVKNFWKRS